MDLEVNELSLTDFSSENDNLIEIHLPLFLLGVLKNTHLQTEARILGFSGAINIQELDWDSAFFTDAGILDADVLSSLIKGGDKQTLPIIEEDVRQALDSISTLESDNLAIEHIESELFGDIRASIQKVAIPTSRDVSAKTDNGVNSSAKNVNLASKDRMKPKIAPKRIIGAQAGIPKSQPKQITGTQRLGKRLNQDKAQVTQSISRTTGGASLKPPKISAKMQPVSASKRASLDIVRVKTDNDSMKIITASVRGAQTPKASALNKASRVLPKPNMSMKPSSVGSSPGTKILATRSSSDSSGSTSSDKTVKSSIPATRRKVDSKLIAQPSASAKLKTPSKAAVKNKLPSGNSAVSAYLISSKINASISPASSISEWSSVSSSSSATINQRSSMLRTFDIEWSSVSSSSSDTSSCRSFDSDTSTLDMNNHLSDQNSDKPENRGTTLPRENLKQAGSVSRPASMMKPSGLRMPSPKMGYFDGVKTVRTPNGTHSNSSTALSKTEATICSPKVNSNTKAKSVKVPLGANRKPETVKQISPLSSSDKSNVSDNHCGTQSSSATALPKTEAIICSPKGNSNMKAKSVRVPLRANGKPETLKRLSPLSSSDKSNVSENHTGYPSDITLIPELSLEVHHELSGANTLKNMDVLAEEPDPFEHIQSASDPILRRRVCFPFDQMGWLLTQSLDGEEVDLLNPFLRTQIQLPNQFALMSLDDEYETEEEVVVEAHHTINKASCLSANPSVTSDYVLVISYNTDINYLAFWLPGDINWTKFYLDGRFGAVSNMIYHKGLFYLVTWAAEIWIVDVQTPERRVESRLIYLNDNVDLFRQHSTQYYLVEVDNALLLVLFCRRRSNRVDTYKCEVYEVDETRGKLEKINNLGDSTIFLGLNS